MAKLYIANVTHTFVLVDHNERELCEEELCESAAVTLLQAAKDSDPVETDVRELTPENFKYLRETMTTKAIDFYYPYDVDTGEIYKEHTTGKLLTLTKEKAIPALTLQECSLKDLSEELFRRLSQK